MHLPTIEVLLNWRNEKNKSGLYSIHLRITISRVQRYYKIPIPQKVAKDQWTGKEDSWVKNHPFAFEINNKIREKKAIVLDLIKRSYNFNKTLSLETIFSHLTHKGDRNSFLDYFESYYTRPPEELALNTIKKYKTCHTHLKAFRSKIHFSDIESSLVTDFYKFLRVDLHLEGGACKKYMEALKKVIKHARKENYIDAPQMEFLFDDVKIKVPKPKRVFMEIEEIRTWKILSFPKGKEYLERDRDLFLFQIYTGYYYKDLQHFSKDHLLLDEEFGYFIVGQRDKNGNQTMIPLYKFPYAATILKKYKSKANSSEIFDSIFIIPEPIYNQNLKEIAQFAGISKSISNKVARHTNAQLWIRYGAERPILSKMMGHTKEQTTQEYFSINIPEIVEGTKRADFGKLGI